MKVFGVDITGDQVAAMERAMWHELADPRGHTWHNHIAARAVVYEGFPDIRPGGASVAAQAAYRCLRKARAAGHVQHIGGGKWRRIVVEPGHKPRSAGAET